MMQHKLLVYQVPISTAADRTLDFVQKNVEVWQNFLMNETNATKEKHF